MGEGARLDSEYRERGHHLCLTGSIFWFTGNIILTSGNSTSVNVYLFRYMSSKKEQLMFIMVCIYDVCINV